MNSELKYGDHTPAFYCLPIRALTRAGLGRGKLVQYIHRLWKRYHGNVIDIRIRSVNYRLDISNNMTDIKILSSSKEYDREELNILKQVCKNGIFVDLGANVGYYTLALAAAGASKALAIEPNPPTLGRLRYNIAINKFGDKVAVAPYGVGEDGTASLPATGDLGTASILDARSKNGAAVTIATRTLAQILDEYNIQKIDGMKVDIEGMEDRALIPFFENTSEERWPKCLVVEHAHTADWNTDLISFLFKIGYRQKTRTRANTILFR